MPCFPTQLANLLSEIKHPGRFYAAGAAEIYAPSLQVEGVGPVALPLLPLQAEQLVAVAERAPYGKGEETLIDTEVRRTWQIGAEKIRIGGKYWEQNLEEIVAWVQEKLGVAGGVYAELYKLLVYDTGSFFVSHRDTEKAAGMFATLVIVLPSAYEGGELLVRHLGQEAQLDLHGDGPSEFGFAAFYADCSHEVLPITSGCRLTLIYNLLRRGVDTLPTPPDYGDEQAHLADWLRQWAEAPITEDEETPLKLVYPLEHAYSQAELSFATLKGADAGRAAVLAAAAEQADCETYLALVSIEESGYAEYTGYSSRRRRYYDDDDEENEFEVGEVTERDLILSDWRRPDGGEPSWGSLPFEENELCPPDAFDKLEPDEMDFQEATGNAGASFDRAYRRAGLVLWPRQRRLAVLNQAGQHATLGYLRDLAGQWTDSGTDAKSPLWAEAHALAVEMLRTWPREVPYQNNYDTEPSVASAFLATLAQLQDRAHIEAFLSDIAAAGFYGPTDNVGLVLAIGLLPLPQAGELLRRIVAASAERIPGACADLLARCVAAPWASGQAAQFAPTAAALVAALPGDPNTPPPADAWRRPVSIEARWIIELLAGLERIDAGLAGQAADCLLARRQAYGFDAVLLPTLLALAGQSGAATQRLRTACLNHLQARIDEPLAPPRDWTRNAALSCHCPHCSSLSHFLADPGQREWSLKAAQTERSHVEDSIRRAVCDVDTKTDTRGRPYTLICVKNQASYGRRVAQRKQDEQHADALRQAAARHGG
ncbi:MAG: 2OG-Fe(II) oxygenase [Candidatus Methylumidiphilus sp.]